LSIEDSLKIVSYKEVLQSTQHDSMKVNALADWEEIIMGLDFEQEKAVLTQLDSICVINLKSDLNKEEKLFFKKKKADCNFDLGDLYRYHFEYDKALDYYGQSKALFKEVGGQNRLAALLNNQGLLYAETGDYALALENYEKSIELFEAAEDSAGWANGLSNIAIISANMGSYDRAITYFTKCLSIDESMGYTEGVASGLNNIGIVYMDFGKYDKALNYFEQCYEIRLNESDIRGQATVKNNIGAVYSLMDSVDLALGYYREGMRLSEEINDKNRMMESLNGIGENYIKKGDFVASRTYLKDALSMGQSLGNDYNISSIFVNLAKSYAGPGDYKKAIEYGQKGLDLGTKIGALNLVSDAAENLYLWNKKTGNSNEALKMHEVYVSTRDSLNRLENKMEIINQEYKYSYDKQKALDDAENEKLIVLEKARSDAALLVQEEIDKKQKVLIYAISVGLILVVGFLIILFKRLRITRKQKDEIDKQKSAIGLQHQLLGETHKELTDSMNYAQHLQAAIFPSFTELDQYLGKHFVYFKPKDVISGDFYWFERVNDVNYIAAADCTGHGVPGAILTVVCSNALNRSVNEYGLTEPNEILNKTRALVIETLGKKGDGIRDGMDISLGAIYSNKVVFAGANNPLWIVRATNLLTPDEMEAKGTVIHGETALIEYKGDKQPIGRFHRMVDFTQHQVPLLTDDRLYFFSDGYIDQFGGERGKKFKSKSLKKFLLETTHFSIEEQKEKLSTNFDQWKGQNEQVDDVCIIGIKIAAKA
jgi:tetratricopeptide (TPR) repeat protein